MIDKNKITFYEQMLQQQLVYEISQEIEKQVMPKIKKNIKSLAEDAAKAWSNKIMIEEGASMRDPFSNGTNIQVVFVENIVNKVTNEIVMKSRKEK